MTRILSSLLGLSLLLTSCQKDIPGTGTNTMPGKPNSTPTFTDYTIKKGNQYCDQNNYRAIETSEMKFLVRFDSSAIYHTNNPANQDDINKLYGFSDNNSAHHLFSARFGWRWSNNALRLFGYVYNNGTVTFKELNTVTIGEEINCSITAISGNYIFTVNNTTDTLPRQSTTPLAKGYQLYPYFGGDESAPHQILIRIKEL
jgi:hypothetical protein